MNRTVPFAFESPMSTHSVINAACVFSESLMTECSSPDQEFSEGWSDGSVD